jgi:GntR family uxuAB operon transcriptional repressor
VRTVSSDQIRSVANSVLRDAAENGLLAGSRLPTERDLAVNLQLTRSTVRSAMALLEAEGVVSREVGRGTYLRRDPGEGSMILEADSIRLDAILKDVGPADVMAARQLLEPAAMYSIVAHATEADFDEMERCLRGCRGAMDYDEFEKWDLSFHRSLMLASHNALLVRMYHLIEVARQGELWGNMKRRIDSNQRRGHSRDQHYDIVTALRNRDVRGAQLAIKAHLDAIETSLQLGARTRMID